MHRSSGILTQTKDLSLFIDLCKIRISSLTALSAAAGYLLALPHFGLDLFCVISGIFFLACGACALNQYQERDIDRLMHRTSQRPIPAFRINARTAFNFSMAVISAGLFLLIMTGNIIILLLGLGAIFWYNGLYTYLKKKSAYAFVPGAVTGAIPPLTGWIAGGGVPNDPQIMLLCFLLIIWQLPHFWLIIINHGEDYERAGLPNLRRIFTAKQAQRISGIWMLALATASMTTPVYGSYSQGFKYGIILTAVWLFGCGIFHLFRNDARKAAFGKTNLFMLFVIVLLIMDRLV